MSLALVTGAGKRLGRAMALGLAQDGYDLALHYATSGDEAEAVAAEIRALGRQAMCFQADLLEAEATRALLPAVRKEFGRDVTLLVNNASIFEHDTIATLTPDSWDRHLHSNLRAPLFLSQAFAAQGLKAQVGAQPVATGLIVNMVDQRVLKPTPEFMTYSLAKAGLWALTRTLAQALAPDIRVNAIAPGPTLKGTRQSETHFAAQRRATILQRGANPDEIVQALRYLISAPSVTGQMLVVDGGQHLAWKTADILGVE